MKALLTSLVIMLLTFSSGAQGIITTIAGGGWGVDGGLAINAALDKVNDVLVDSGGNVYIAEDEAIRKIDAQTQIISLYAGSYQTGVGCDGCPATTAKLNLANAIAMDKQGNLYIADYGSCRIRKVDALTGIMTTYAGNAIYGYSGDGGPATSARLKRPMDIAFDANDNLYIADEFYHIRRVDRQTGIITTVAGDGIQGTWNNGDLASAIRLGSVRGVAIDKAGDIYFADFNGRRIGRIDGTGVVYTYCGTGTLGISGDGGPATDAQIGASAKIRFDEDDNLFLADGTIRKIERPTGIINMVAGPWSGFCGDGGPATQACLSGVMGVWVEPGGDFYIADGLNYRIRKVTYPTSVPTVEKEQNVRLYPNPSNSIVFFESDNDIPRIEIYDISGRLILSKTAREKKVMIDISSFATGTYTTLIFSGLQVKAEKLLRIP